MKIAHFIYSFNRATKGGAEIHVYNICVKLAQAGHEPILITLGTPPKNAPDFPFKVVYLNKNLHRLIKYIPKIGKWVLHKTLHRLQQKYNFDVWQITLGYRFSVHAVDYFNKHHIPCALRCAGEDINVFPEINYGFRLNKGFDLLAKKNYPKYDALIALTESVKQEYLAMDIAEKKIHIIPNGMDFGRFQRVKQTNSIREKYNISDNEIFILTVGRHHPIKGYHLIPEMAEILIKNGVNFKWLIVGAKNEQFHKQFPNADKLNIITTKLEADTANNDGQLPPLALIEHYKSADLFVFPTLLETFGMVLVEAMAAGLPIVTTDAPGVRDVVEQNLTGIKVPSGNATAMAQKIIEVINNKELCEQLKNNALQTAEKLYDWDVVLGKYISLYNSLVKENVIK